MKFWKAMLLVLGLAAVIGCQPAGHQPHYRWEGHGRYVVAITSPGCGQCHKDMPTVRAMNGQNGIRVIEINGDEHPEICRQYGVTQYPTYLVFEDGELLHKVFTLKNLVMALKFLFWIASIFLL